MPQFSEAVVFLGDGAGAFSFVDGPGSLAVGDFKGDGIPDVAVANSGGENVTVLVGDGSGNFGSASFDIGFGPTSVAVGDFNGDGNDDLVTGNDVDIEPADVSVLLGDGKGSFAEPQHFLGGVFIVSVAVADFDGDGNQDVAAAEFAVGLRVLLGDGSGDLPSFVDFPTTFGGPQSVTVGDFNGDSRPDLAVANGDNDKVGILLNTTIATPELANVAVTCGAGARSIRAGQDHARCRWNRRRRQHPLQPCEQDLQH